MRFWWPWGPALERNEGRLKLSKLMPDNPRENPPKRFACLIVEDDAAFATLAESVVRSEGGDPVVCRNLAAAREVSAARHFDLVLLDNHLPDGKGYDFYSHLARRQPDAPIVMITGAPDLGEAINLTRNGLFDYLTKPVELEALTDCLRRARLRIDAKPGANVGPEWFGESAAMKEVVQQLRQAARHSATTVLITGETGTGKDVAARILHQLSHPDGKAPFVPVNCAAMPADMFEAELFGAEKGAYTGADRKRPGLAASTANGTLFLDEIAEVPLNLQAKLLRLLESREFRPLGAAEAQAFTGRFVAATNKVLADEVHAGRFREDLLYRLDVFTVELPPLRERREDIPGLAELLLGSLCSRYERTKLLIKPDDLASLTTHEFAGNVRELRNILERSLLLADADSRWLSLDLNRLRRSAAAAPVSAAVTATKSAAASPPDRQLNMVEAQEYQLIRQTLDECRGGIRRAAAKLGISPQALLRRLEKWPELRPASEE